MNGSGVEGKSARAAPAPLLSTRCDATSRDRWLWVHREQLYSVYSGTLQAGLGQQRGCADLRRQPGQPRRDRAAIRRALRILQGRYRECRSDGCAHVRASLLCGDQFRRGIARRSQHQFSAELHSYQCRGHERAPGLRAAPRRPAFRAGLDRRSLRLVRRDRQVHRAIAAPAEFALFREQSRRRPARARLPSNLRPGSDRHPLLEQLRALSVSGEVDPAHDHQSACATSRCRSMATA